ncbi:MAG: NADP-dependent glyceraldehyde-3-phosphate dehydrogenase [Patescibacteria group bacterium]|nr:NADP-dependent glyceraldehyde-3-phosphate dehydrogenase [Patescibacteria group bacterium]
MEIKEKINSLFPEENKIPPEFLMQFPVIQTEYLVNGELHHWNGPMLDVFSPLYLKTPSGLTQKLIGKYPLLTEKESLESLHSAVEAYDNGMGFWPTRSVAERIKYVEDFVYRMKEKRTDIVNLLMWEIGKSYQDSIKEFDRTVDYIKDTIDALKDLDRISSRFTIEQGIIGQIRRAPLGVVLCMGPFNYPLNETFTTLIPALIMGNTLIFKPPKLGVLLHCPLLEAFRDSFPPGVVNTVYGEGPTVISPLMTSGEIDVLAFIGSSRVADILKKQHPKPHQMRSILGLDAKNPAIILPDADLDLTVKECILGCLSYNGQRCTALKILFVHSKIVNSFLQRFSDAVAALKIGMPWEPNVNITPLAEPDKTKYLSALIADAQQSGASVVNPSGGTVNKTFLYPAVVYPVNSQMRLYAEEQFGPVIPVISYDDITVPINYIAESNYGQQVSIFGEDYKIIAQLIDQLVNQVCRVNVNSQCQRGPDTFPFTGRKDSAEGTLSVSDALRVFSIRTLVAAKESDINKSIITKIVRERKSNFLSTDFIL